MKRVLQYKNSVDGYGCYESNELVFEIKKADLQFNVRDFYQTFYGEGKDIEEIIVENMVEDDKDAARIYGCIQTLVSQIGEKLQELPNINSSDIDDESNVLEK